MNRRDLFRSALVTLGATASAPALKALQFAPDADASKDLERADWKPIFMDDHQNETLIALSDLIIPETDTPGAKAALVNRFLDLLMSAESAETQRAFVEALSYIDGTSMESYNGAFLHITPEQQVEFLEVLAYPHTNERWGVQEPDFPGTEHFEKLKGWISGAYYSSPIGLKELGWDGSFPHGVFAGCEHASHEHPEQAGH